MKKIRAVLFTGLLCAFGFTSKGQVAAGLQKHVNLFTGDFNYNIPLPAINGPNGEQFPLQLNYHADIKTNQEASWVGLGWSLNLGEITRQVNGMPDDWNSGVYKIEKLINSSGATTVLKDYHGYGPVWFHAFDHDYTGPVSLMDIAYSKRKAGSKDPGFEFPDYDEFYVSGPGIGGKMRGYLFDYAHFHAAPANNFTYGDPNSTGFEKFSKRVQFRLVNDPSTAKLRHTFYASNNYYKRLIDDNSSGSDNSWTGNLNAWDNAVRTPAYMENNGYGFFGDRKTTQNTEWDKRQTVYGANYVEYFTNGEIYNHYDNAATIPGGFIDHKDLNVSTCNRGATDDAIGAYRITTPEGFTYHYSLPLYVNEESHTSCAFQNINSTPVLKANEHKEHRKTTKYAYSWKLTAITGPDYEDVNSNNFVDEGDKGYWVYINYEKWNKQDKYFIQRSPYYGYFIDKIYKELPTSNYSDPSYQLQGSKSIKYKDVYYPNYVKTASQTLFFIKEIRKDAHSASDASQTDVIPRLRLKEVILLNNEDVAANNLFSSYSSMDPGQFNNLSNYTNVTSQLNSGDYTTVKTTVDNLSLARVSLAYDYSMCPGVYNNIDNSIVSPAYYTVYGNNVFEKTIPISGTGGKLTLNTIYMFGDAGTNIYGSKAAYQFIYPPITTTDNLNPEYHHDYQDFFGNYKAPKDISHFDRVGYCTDEDKASLPAWSIEKIITPLGGELKIKYQPDNYSEVSFQNSRLDIPDQPTRFFNFRCEGSDCSTLVFSDPNAMDFFTSIDNHKTELRVKYLCPNATDTTEESAHYTYKPAGVVNSSNPDYKYDLSAAPFSLSNCSGTVNLNNAQGRVIIHMEKVFGGGTRVKTISITEPDRSETYGIDLSYGVGVIGTENGRWENRFNVKKKPSLLQADRFSPSNTVGYKNVKVRLQSVNRNVPNNLGQDFGEVEYQFYYEPDVFKKSSYTGFRFYEMTTGGKKEHYKNFQKIYNYKLGLYGNLRKKIVKDREGVAIQTDEYIYGPETEDIVNTVLEEFNVGKTSEIFFKETNGPSPNGGSSDVLQHEQVFAYEESRYKLKKIKSSGLNKREVDFNTYDLWNGKNMVTETVEPVEYETTQDFIYKTHTEMGSKFLNIDYTNQLNAVEETSNSRNKEQNAFSTWGNDYLVREQGSNGSYASSTHSDKIWQPNAWYAGTADPITGNYDPDKNNWIRTNKSLLYNANYSPVEQIDRLGNFSAQKFDLNHELPISSAVNSSYLNYVHCGFEYTEQENGQIYFENEVYRGQYQQSAEGGITPHTGDYMAKVSRQQQWGPVYKLKRKTSTIDGEVLEQGLIPGKTYEASIWMHNSSPDASILVMHLMGNNSSGVYSPIWMGKDRSHPSNIIVGDWTLVRLSMTIPEGYTTPDPGHVLSVSFWNYDNATNGTAYIDDFRLQTIDAQVEATVYDKRRKLPRWVLDNENFYTELEYDAAGNVIRTYRETESGKTLIQENTIHYAQ